MIPPIKLPDHLDSEDLDKIRRESEGKICPHHTIDMVPVFNADYAIVGWECWACKAGAPPLTEEEKARLHEVKAQRQREYDQAADSAEFDPWPDDDECEGGE